MTREMYDKILRRKTKDLGVTPEDFDVSLLAQGIALPGATPEEERRIALQMMPD